MNHAVPRRAVLGLLPALALAGCSSFSRNSPFWGTLRAGAEGGVDGKSTITREYADNLPYASMRMWFDGSAPAMVVLAEITTDKRWVWHSAERQAIIGFGPVITSLLGLDFELRGTTLQGAWDRNVLQMVGRNLARVLDVSAEGERVQVHLKSRFMRDGSDDIEILGSRRQLVVVNERVSAEGRPRFTNRYWVDSVSGRCWKSIQTVIPTMPKLNIEVLKYPNA